MDGGNMECLSVGKHSKGRTGQIPFMFVVNGRHQRHLTGNLPGKFIWSTICLQPRKAESRRCLTTDQRYVQHSDHYQRVNDGVWVGVEVSVALYDKLAGWAQSKRQLAALHIFGARARGDHRPDSALKLALEFIDAEDEIRLLHDHALAWKQELADLSGLDVAQLELRSNKQIVRLPIVTVYRRPTS